jgi:hypothetical protein
LFLEFLIFWNITDFGKGRRSFIPSFEDGCKTILRNVCSYLSADTTQHNTPENMTLNPLTPELNPSAQRYLPRFFTGILIFKRLTARHLYTSFGVKGLNNSSTKQ